mmetsp:Transcript_9102/g.25929  ORF Transcript_9102/g.25929 Transcript_9102/m.25929 type:complete len:111 (-) Transcript_9102:216-548(-)
MSADVEFAYQHVDLDRSFEDQSTFMAHVTQLLHKHGARYSGTGLGIVGYPNSASTVPPEESITAMVGSSLAAPNAISALREYGSADSIQRVSGAVTAAGVLAAHEPKKLR